MLSVLLQSRPWQADRASLVVEKEGNPWTLQCTSQKAPDVNPGMIGLCQISSFVCEVRLRVTPAQERILVARLEAARQVYNACLGEARTRVRLVRESKAFQRARTLPRADPARKTLFAQARQQHAFSNYALHAYVQAIGKA